MAPPLPRFAQSNPSAPVAREGYAAADCCAESTHMPPEATLSPLTGRVEKIPLAQLLPRFLGRTLCTPSILLFAGAAAIATDVMCN